MTPLSSLSMRRKSLNRVIIHLALRSLGDVPNYHAVGEVFAETPGSFYAVDWTTQRSNRVFIPLDESVMMARDVIRDGYDDFIIRVNHEEAWVFHGSPAGLACRRQWANLARLRFPGFLERRHRH